MGAATFGGGAALGSGFASRPGWRVNGGVSRAQPVATLSELPDQADVVIIGGGIAGISASLFLKEKGFDVVVLEKGAVAAEQSSRAYGLVFSSGWDLGKLEMANHSKRLWDGFASRFGQDIGFRASGSISMFGSDDEVEGARPWVKEALQAYPDMDVKFINPDDVDAYVPGTRDRVVGGLFSQSDGSAEPTYSVSRMAEGATREGVKIVAPCAARALEREAGAISGVITEWGFIKTRTVVLAGGAWSSLFARNAGVDFPMLSIISSNLRLAATNGPLKGTGGGMGLGWRVHADGDITVGAPEAPAPIMKDSFRYLRDFWPALSHAGGLVDITPTSDFFASLWETSRWNGDEVSPFEDVRMLSARPDHAAVNRAFASLLEFFPEYKAARVKEVWAGVVDATPDSTQYIDSVPGVPGLLVSTGFSGGGFTTGPASGQMIAEMIAGEKTTCDPKIYRLDRFSDGSEFVMRH